MARLEIQVPRGPSVGRRRRLRPARLRAGWLLVGVWAMTPAVHAGPDAVASCARDAERGRSEAARDCYRALLAEGVAPAWSAEAHWALGDRTRANDAFREAVAAAPRDARVRVRWAELFVETYQLNEAEELLREALEIEPGRLDAALLDARLAAERGDPAALERARSLSERFAGRAEPALLGARLELEAGDLSAAAEALARADSAGSLEACSAVDQQRIALWAALELRRGREADPWVARAMACNSRSGAVFAVPAEMLVRTRRYREAVALLIEAVACEPERWSAHAELAIQLMRINELERARRHLEIAFAGAPYDPRVVNTLRLLDRLETFRTLRTETGPVQSLLRMDAAEAQVLAPYVLELTQRASAHMSERYRFQLSEPIVIELYPNHDDFAVRTAGMPGLGILGATFGYVVAMDSPSARPPDDELHWGSVLWHELAHVFTLEATRHRVPRWLSEGISVLEEWESGPAPQPALPVDFVTALREGRLLPIAKLDDGFQRPTWPGQVGVSYVQAGLVCEWIAQRFGVEALADLLEGFARGGSDAGVLPEVLELSLGELDVQVAEHARERSGALLLRLDAWRASQTEAQRALREERFGGAAKAAGRALEIRPDDVSAASAHLILARALRAQGDAAGALGALETFHGRGGRDPAALRELASELYQRGLLERAISVLGDLRFVTPFDEKLHADLGEWLLEADRPADALVELQVLAALEPLDRVGLHLGLARAYHRLERRSEARREVLYALEIAPELRSAQRLLLEMQP